MGIVVKFIIKNIYEKKFRTFLILFSIVISSALFFASTAISDTMVKMFENRMRNYYGSTQIVVTPKEKSPSPFFSPENAKALNNRAEYIVGAIQGSGSYKFKDDETVNFQLVGVDVKDFQNMNPISFDNDSNLYPFEGKKIIISKNTADKYNLKIGDTLELEIGQGKFKFYISAIALPSGLFFDDGMSTYGIMPIDTLRAIYNARGKVNLVCIKLKNPAEIKQTITELSSAYDRYSVQEPFSKEEMKRQTQGMSTSFLLMAVIVTLMSVFIIYTSFKVVTMERLPVIGTFRSIGATRKMTDMVLLVESTLYGVVGGLLGCILGIGILYIMAIASTPVWVKGFKATIEFTPLQLLAAFLFAVVLSFVSCIIPIVKVSKIPVKDIVLNAIEKQKKNKILNLFMGIAFLAFAFFAPPFAPRQLALVVDTLGMLLSVAAVIQLVPYFTGLFVYVFEKAYIHIFGNEGVLAAKNLKENKSILNNISLLAIGISSLLMINTISFSVVTELSSFYRSANFDVWIFYMPNADRNLERSLSKVDGVEKVYGVYEARGIEVVGSPHYISLVQGVDKTKFQDFWNMDMPGDRKALLEELDKDRNVILTNSMKEKLGAKIGDTITLKMKQGNKEYKVIGFVNTLRNNGSYALISERFAKADSDSQFYSNLFVKANKDPVEVQENIQKQFVRRHPYMMNVNEMESKEKQSNANTFNILKGFSILALIIGIFGVLNNLIISFIERKRSLAMFKSVGMSRKQVIKMIFIEAFSGGLIGGIIGLLAGFLMIWGVPYVLMSIDLFVPIRYPFDSLIYYVLAGIAIVLAASVSPALKSSKLNIIESIKYE